MLTENRYYVTQEVEPVGAARLANEETRVRSIGVYIRGSIMISLAFMTQNRDEASRLSRTPVNSVDKCESREIFVCIVIVAVIRRVQH